MLIEPLVVIAIIAILRASPVLCSERSFEK